MLESEGKNLFFYTCKRVKFFYLHEADIKSVIRDLMSHIEMRFHVLVLPGFDDSRKMLHSCKCDGIFFEVLIFC